MPKVKPKEEGIKEIETKEKPKRGRPKKSE